MKINRRNFLKGVGVTSILPLGEILANDSQENPGGSELIKEVLTAYKREEPNFYQTAYNIHKDDNGFPIVESLDIILSDGTRIRYSTSFRVDIEIGREEVTENIGTKNPRKITLMADYDRASQTMGGLTQVNEDFHSKENEQGEVGVLLRREEDGLKVRLYSLIRGRWPFGSFDIFMPAAQIPSAYQEFADLIFQYVKKARIEG
ncbi:MAG: hypothetical protein AABW81_04475 [Nanoarchaeota archaeon]